MPRNYASLRLEDAVDELDRPPLPELRVLRLNDVGRSLRERHDDDAAVPLRLVVVHQAISALTRQLQPAPR